MVGRNLRDSPALTEKERKRQKRGKRSVWPSDRLSPMPWYEITFSPEDINARRAITLIQEFGDICIACASPKDAALFKRNESAYVYYLSPGAARIAAKVIVAYSGVACSAPTRSEVKLMAGDRRLDEIPFADL
jgi:hypothetical protein